MIVRNVRQEEVLRRVYTAHGGAIATMLFDSSELQGILFFAYALLKPGRVIESHTDPYEEIYCLIQGQGTMTVGDEQQTVTAGDSVWLPHGVSHSLANTGDDDCIILVAAGMPRSY